MPTMYLTFLTRDSFEASSQIYSNLFKSPVFSDRKCKDILQVKNGVCDPMTRRFNWMCWKIKQAASLKYAKIARVAIQRNFIN